MVPSPLPGKARMLSAILPDIREWRLHVVLTAHTDLGNIQPLSGRSPCRHGKSFLPYVESLKWIKGRNGGASHGDIRISMWSSIETTSMMSHLDSRRWPRRDIQSAAWAMWTRIWHKKRQVSVTSRVLFRASLTSCGSPWEMSSLGVWLSLRWSGLRNHVVCFTAELVLR